MAAGVGVTGLTPILVVGGGAADRRVALFQEALAGLGRPPALVVSYADILNGRYALGDLVAPCGLLRIESPGKSLEMDRRLLLAGADLADAEGDGTYERLDRRAVLALRPERGRLVASRQWYLGLCRALDLLAAQLSSRPDIRLMACPADVALLFDKRRCHARLRDAGVPVPASLPPVVSFEDLAARLHEAGLTRVFVKLAHGSSASGIVALSLDARRAVGTSTVELVGTSDGVRLYNTRRLRVYRGHAEVAPLVDALCRQRAHVERWLPKASMGGRALDVRVVVIAGRARHTVVRLSPSPITNLHLLNDRSDPSALMRRMGGAAWSDVLRACERSARVCAPDSLYAGVDLAVVADFRRHAVLEVNAFGDLLPGVTSGGQDTYTAELLAVPPYLRGA